jgi:DNA-binding XRE family transcriptional regulator
MTTPQMSAEDLRTVRYHLELNQAEMGDRLGVAVRTIGNWEAHGVPAYRVPRIQRALGPVLREALDGKRHTVEESYEAVQRDSTTPEERRAQLLHLFTDLDLLSELQARALRREAARAA